MLERVLFKNDKISTPVPPVWAGRDGQEIDPETGRDLSLSFNINRDINELVIRNFKNHTAVARLEYAEQ